MKLDFTLAPLPPLPAVAGARAACGTRRVDAAGNGVISRFRCRICDEGLRRRL